MSLNHLVGVRGPYTPIQVSTIHGDFPITTKPFLSLGMSSDGQIIGITGTQGITGTMGITGGAFIGVTGVNSGIIISNTMGITGGQNIGITGTNIGYGIYNTPNSSFDSITLSQTSALPPSSLSYYNESSWSNQFTGIWSTTQNSNMKFTKIGKLVTCTCFAISATANTSTQINSLLPSPDYYPTTTFSTPLIVLDNGVNLLGRIDVRTDGIILIYSSIINGAFTGIGASGFNAWNISWETA